MRNRVATRRVWVSAAVAGAVLLLAGTAVLWWPADGARSGAFPTAAPERTGRAALPGSAAADSTAGVGADGSVRASAPDAGGAAAPEVASTQQLPPMSGGPLGGGQRALVRTAQLTVAVDDATTATRQVRTTAAAAGGLVVQEQSGERGSWLVLRVPADTLDRVLDDIAAIGRVTDRTGQVTDSTGEIVDLDARVASQQASVVRVRGLLAQATSIGDIVAVESELARREADLDALTSRLAVLRDQVAMSTLTVDLRIPPPVPADDADDRAAGFTDGLEAGWKGLLALGTAVAAVIGFLLPMLPVLAVLLGIGWMVRRLLRARRTPATETGGRSGPGSDGES
ncbi:MAG TPA: DUF4349 domain-containing protein [Pseudonocardia sp.]|nr:DUF4349 domain-containing protein [Pseudonocardia sp.]